MNPLLITKVCVATSAHPALDPRIFLKQCRSLREAGYDVTLIVPHDHDEDRDGVHIKAVPKPTGRMWRYTRTLWDVYREAVKLRADVYHVHDPELLFVGAMLKIRTGSRTIFDAHEDYPNVILRRDWIPEPFRKALREVAKLVLRFTLPLFDAVVAATEDISEKLPHRDKIVVQNYTQLDIGSFEQPHEPDLLIYAGAITNERGLGYFLEAFRLMNEHRRVRLRLVGVRNDPEVTKFVIQRCPPNLVEIFEWRPQTQALELIAPGTLGLVMDLPHPGTDGPPTKLFDYMALGLPAVGSHLPTARTIIGETGCGVTVDFRKPQEVADKILELLGNPSRLEDMRQKGFAACKAYQWTTQAERLIALYRRLGGKRTRWLSAGDEQPTSDYAEQRSPR